MKRILINATQPEELRVALVDGQKLYDLDIESSHQQKKKANIYKGIVTRIEPSLEAAFVDYGADRHGFLPFKELSDEFFAGVKKENGEKITILDVLKERQEIVVQVQKEERGNKGAALSTQIALAGPYVVMMPNTPNSGGISRRVEGDDRSDIRQVLHDLNIPDGMSTIIRTAGVGKNADELQWGVDYLSLVWQSICQAVESRPAPFLVYQESDIIIRALRDHLRNDVGEILIDHEPTWQKARDFVQQVMPAQLEKIHMYQDRTPLFNRFQIENQIESAYQREVVLPSGGVIVIDNTEALTAIDINSSRATKGGDIEETAFNTNLEAAEEIARQLRLRDLGGLIVIDFIDMMSSKHQREVENRLKDSVKSDRARIQIGRISRFGLLELSRQRLRPSLEESTQLVCPRCRGLGVIRGVESIALSILRQIEEAAIKDNTHRIMAQMPVDVATFLLNEKRDEILRIENRHRIHVMLIPNEHMETPHYTIERFKSTESHPYRTSYEAKTRIESSPEFLERELSAAAAETPAVGHLPAAAAPVPMSTPMPKAKVVTPSTQQPDNLAPEGGWLKRLWGSLFGKAAESAALEEAPTPKASNSRRDGNRNGRGRRDRNERGDRSANPRQQNDMKATETKPAVAQTETSEGRPQSGRGRRERQPRHDRQATANDSNLSVEQIAEKTQAEVQAMSRAAMDRINAKVDEVATPLPTAAAEENPRRSARAERMSRPDRWERQVAVDPSVIPAHQADSDPALIAAQDAAADSLMGNRALRAHAVNALTEVSTSAPEPVVAPAATIQEPAFVVQTQFVAETSTTQHIDQVDHTESTLHEAAPTDDAITTTEESTTEQPPRRTGTRRGLYRRRTGGRRPNNRRDGATDEHAPTEHIPSESN